MAGDRGPCRDLTVCPQEKDPIGLEITIPAVSFCRGRGSGNRAGTLMYSGSLNPFSMDSNPLSVCRQLVLGGHRSPFDVSRGRAAAQVFETGPCSAATEPRGRTLCAHGCASVVPMSARPMDRPMPSLAGAGGSLRTLPTQTIP